jgi:hypothetical protein
MSTELTNLIPRSKTKRFRREYFTHLATVAFFMLTLLVGAQCLLLLPSYIYERQAVDSETTQLSTLSANLSTAQEKEVQTRLASLQAKGAFLGGFSTVPTASTALRAVLAVTRTGITLNGFTFTPPKAGALGVMQLSGTAATRETLRSYDAALSALPFVKTADLPISSYAKASAIPFTITLTMSSVSTPTP